MATVKKSARIMIAWAADCVPCSMSRFTAFTTPMNVVVVGASGGIGGALVRLLLAEPQVGRVCALSRSGFVELAGADISKLEQAYIDFDKPGSYRVLDNVLDGEPLDLVLVASGLLHAKMSRASVAADTQPGLIKPEKRLQDIELDSLERVFHINTFAPLLVAQHLLPRMRKQSPAVFAAWSARVGSISDNRLGGWYAYRASKAALNMLLKTLAIEMARSHPQLRVVGLHPGTVATRLSAPFRNNVPASGLFAPEQSAGYLLDVVDGLQPEHSGQVLAWDGQVIPP